MFAQSVLGLLPENPVPRDTVTITTQAGLPLSGLSIT
jgi:hypothetical protein